MPDFLLEIGTEEIPARMIQGAERDLRQRVEDLCAREALGGGNVESFSTPRRISVLAGVMEEQPFSRDQIIGPSVNVAYKDDQPTQAAQAFAKKAGVDVSQLQRIKRDKGEYVAVWVEKRGRRAMDILAESLPKEIASIYWPKNMYWRKPNERFVRPVRWLVAMIDDQVVPLEFGGVRAGDHSRGHRILSSGEVQIPRAGSAYLDALREAKVLGRVDREHQIRKALDAATRTIPGARWREDAALLDTVVNLTEWPSAILGSFDPEFLELPEEVLVTVMRDHQKYFAIEDAKGKLLPHFLAVLNTDGDPQGLIRHGNERVLRARFNDARFFWQSDQKHTLRDRVCWLKNVTFQKDLGSYYEKTLRVQRLCSWITEDLKQSGVQVRPGVVHKAVCLSKTDLTTELVKEFTELQGIVGGLYARAQVLDKDIPQATQDLIAQTIYDQYKPESAEDSVPRTVEGAVLSICDKADSIAGMFSLGLQPTGSKDPFALRRQANGIVKTIAEHKLPLGISRLFELARGAYKESAAEQKFKRDFDYENAIAAFFRERLEFYLRDQLGFPYDVVNAVLAAGADNVVDAVARAEAVWKVRGSADFESISAAFKRMRNITRQAEQLARQANVEVSVRTEQVASEVNRAAKQGSVSVGSLALQFAAQDRWSIEEFERQMNLAAKQLHETAEKALAAQAVQVAAAVEQLRGARQYEAALTEIAKLRPSIDTFFDKVMVMVDDERLRANRLALLQTLLSEFSTIADFSEIVTEGKA